MVSFDLKSNFESLLRSKFDFIGEKITINWVQSCRKTVEIQTVSSLRSFPTGSHRQGGRSLSTRRAGALTTAHYARNFKFVSTNYESCLPSTTLPYYWKFDSNIITFSQILSTCYHFQPIINDFYWDFESYLTYFIWKKSSYFVWTKFENSDHSAATVHRWRKLAKNSNSITDTRCM